MAAQEKGAGVMTAKATALSPRRLMLLTGLLVAAIGVLFFGKIEDEAESRRIETALRVENAASECGVAANVALMTGDPVSKSLRACAPGGRAAVYHLSSTGDVLAATGSVKSADFEPADAQGLALTERGSAVILLTSGKAVVAWRPLDNGEAALVAAPVEDIYARSPVSLFYLLVLSAVSVAIASLMAAFIRQSRAAALAAGAVDTLQATTASLAAGRAGVWSFDAKERTVSISRTFLEAAGLGGRDRSFTMREITALVHPDDLRGALAVITGDTSGVTEASVRIRQPAGGWTRAYLRTAGAATRFNRSGLAFDLSGSKSMSPSAAIAEARLKDAIESIPGSLRTLGRARKARRLEPPLRHRSSASRPKRSSRGSPPWNSPRWPAAAATSSRNFRAGRDDRRTERRSRAAERQLAAHIPPSDRRGRSCLHRVQRDRTRRRMRAQKKKERELEATVSDLQSLATRSFRDDAKIRSRKTPRRRCKPVKERVSREYEP